MKKYEKEVQQALLDEEKRVLAELEDNYAIALHDINLKLENLLARNDADLPHVIYQIEYQKALKTQVQAILEQLQVNEFETVSDYLTRCYNTGFIGSMYSFHKQGLPFLMPIDQKQVVDAIQHKTKLKKKLYEELGVDIKKLQKTIAGEISRGISTGLGFGDIARNISLHSKAPLNRAMTIARTESHRIQCQATSDAQYKAKEKGADVVKQWDAALDGATRPHHRLLDGQIRELEEPFEVAGMTAMFPGDFGEASEDCNCRCALLQRARWALDKEELEELREKARYHGLLSKDSKEYGHVKAKDFADFQKKYLKASEQVRDSGQKMNDEDTSQEQATDKKKPTNKNGEEIQFEFSQMNEERQKMVRETIEELASKYNTNLIKVVDGAAHYGKNRSHMGIDGIMVLSRGETKEIVIHEFGHSLAIQKAEKMGIQNNSAFWKELRKIHKEYKDEVFRYGQKQYALDGTGYAESIDEFLAEGFAAAILNDKNVNEKYPQKVIAIIDKYFKKETLENTGKNGIIKVGNDISKYIGKGIVKADNQSVREWYYANVHDISNQIDKSKSIEEQSRQAYELRNKYKHTARVAMTDRETAERLERKFPAKSFDELLQDKMKRKNMTREEALKDILKTASKTNADVDKEFGL